MFSSFVAGLRHKLVFVWFAILSFMVTSAAARDEVLFTSSVSYCAPPESLLIQRFSITYFAANASVSFNISAASVEPDVRVSANLLLNVYGMQPVNLTLDFCDGSVLQGALCPLPTYNFTGSDSISLPSSVDVSSNVPGIAYKVPDLEAFAQLTLTDVDTGKVKACVQSTLSNGWSTYQPSVGYSTGGLAILALLSALFHSTRSPEAIAPFRFLDLISLFQTIAASGLLDLNYPLAYRSFTLNFAWSLGLFASTADSRIQNAIDNMRHRTGGTMPDANGGSAVDLVNRRLSPYNILPAKARFDVLNPYTSSNKLFTSVSKAPSGDVGAGGVATVTQGSSNVLDAGVPVYVNSIGIATANAFMSVFITMLVLMVIYLGVAAMGWGGVWAWRRKEAGKEKEKEGKGKGLEQAKAKAGEELGVGEGVEGGKKADEWAVYYPWWARAWGLRLCLVAFTPLTLFSLYQWTLRDSWLSILLSVVAFLFIMSAILYPTFLTFRLVRRTKPWTLYTHTQHVMAHGPLYVQYRPPRWWFFVIPLSAMFFRSLVIAFAHTTGLTQVILLLVSELAFLGSVIVLKPHETRGGDVLSSSLSIFRLAIIVLLFVFVESFRVKPIPRVVVGLVGAVIGSVFVIVMFINTLVNLGIHRFWQDRVRCSRRGAGRWACCGIVFGVGWGTRLSSLKSSSSSSRSKPSPNASSSELEKGTSGPDSDTTIAPSPVDTNSRPPNPTPLQNVPLDPNVRQAYPEVTPNATPSTASWEMSTSSIPSPLPTASTSSYGYYSYTSENGAHSPGPMPNSASADSDSSGSTNTTLGEALPRRREYEDLGLRTPTVEEEEGGERDVDSSAARTFGRSRPSDATVRP